MERGHKLEINNHEEYIKLVKRFSGLNLLTARNLENIQMENEKLTKDRMLEIIKENDQNLFEKIKKLFKI